MQCAAYNTAEGGAIDKDGVPDVRNDVSDVRNDVSDVRNDVDGGVVTVAHGLLSTMCALFPPSQLFSATDLDRFVASHDAIALSLGWATTAHSPTAAPTTLRVADRLLLRIFCVFPASHVFDAAALRHALTLYAELDGVLNWGCRGVVAANSDAYTLAVVHADGSAVGYTRSLEFVDSLNC